MMSSRGKNFTEREKCKLLELIQNYKHIIENKCTNAVSTKRKSDAWLLITTQYNSTAEVPRTVKQLNTAYLNLKRSTRQNIANENVKKYLELRRNNDNEEQTTILIDESNLQEDSQLKDLLNQFKKDAISDKKGVMATGGGIFKPKLSTLGAQMLAVMGDQVKPLANNCDSASSYYYNEESVTSHDILPVTVEVVEHNPQNKNDATPSTITTINKKRKRKNMQQKKKELPKNTDFLKKQYYQKKRECVMIEKKIKLLEYNTMLKKQKLLELEIKIKQKEYDLLNK